MQILTSVWQITPLVNQHAELLNLASEDIILVILHCQTTTGNIYPAASCDRRLKDV